LRKIRSFSKTSFFNFFRCLKNSTHSVKIARSPPTACATSCYGAEHPRGGFRDVEGYSSVASNMRGVLFGTLSKFYFQQNTSPYISHDTDTMMTLYDTGGTEIP
jgi:hypothetical protein